MFEFLLGAFDTFFLLPWHIFTSRLYTPSVCQTVVSSICSNISVTKTSIISCMSVCIATNRCVSLWIPIHRSLLWDSSDISSEQHQRLHDHRHQPQQQLRRASLSERRDVRQHWPWSVLYLHWSLHWRQLRHSDAPSWRHHCVTWWRHSGYRNSRHFDNISGIYSHQMKSLTVVTV